MTTTTTSGVRLPLTLDERPERVVLPAVLYRPHRLDCTDEDWHGYGDFCVGAIRVSTDGSVVWHELATITEGVWCQTVRHYLRDALEQMPGKTEQRTLRTVDGFDACVIGWCE